MAAPPLWKYGARDANPRRIGPLNLPIIDTIATDHPAAYVGNLEWLTYWGQQIAARCAHDSEDRQSRDVQGRRTVRPGIADADVQRRLNRMIAGARRIVAGSAGPREDGLTGGVVYPRHSGDVDLGEVEDILPACDRLARRGDMVVPS